jgi:uncharacterized protein
MQTEHEDHDNILSAARAGDEDEVAAVLSIDNRLTRAVDADGWTPLHLAAHYDHARVVQTLLANNADVHARSQNAMKNQPLHAAAAGKATKAARALIDGGADVNATQVSGFTPLHSAAQNGNRELVVLLLERGAKADAASDDGRTPLAFAEAGGHEDVAQLLRRDKTT